MKIKYCTNYEEMSQLSCDSIIATLKKKPKQLICVATGNSPTGLYGELANYYVKEPKIFKELGIIKLDEWGGIDPNDANSCESYIRKHILTPLHISDDHLSLLKAIQMLQSRSAEKFSRSWMMVVLWTFVFWDWERMAI